jgi:ribosomal protein L37AE/L43A
MKNDNESKEPYELFGIECGDGWKKLYEPIIEYIEEYNKDKKEEDKIEIYQIKEKFGSIRIYLSHYNDELRQMIDDAEEQSYYTCEECGKYIKKPIVEHHWIYPMCRECYDGMKEKQERAIEEIAMKIKEKKKMRRENK